MVNAKDILSEAEIRNMSRYIELCEQIDALESEKKVLNNAIKDTFENVKIDGCNLDGTEFKVINSNRKTVSKASKDEFVQALITLNKKHLVQMSIEPLVDDIIEEAQIDNNVKMLADKYIKITPVKVLKTT